MSEIHDFAIRGSEGLPLSLSLHLPETGDDLPVIFVCHGFKGFKDWGFFHEIGHRLCDRGFAVVRIGFAHNGIEPGTHGSEFSRLDLFERDRMSFRLEDLAAARGAVSQRQVPQGHRLDPERCGVFGHSLGGAVAILGCAKGGFRAITTLASVGSLRLDPQQEEILRREGRLLIPNARTGQMMPVGLCALEDIEKNGFDLETAAGHGVPWLIVHGDQDPTVPHLMAERLRSWAKPGSAELLIIEGGDHALGCRHPFDGPTPGFDRFASAMQTFFEEALRSY